MKKILTLGLLFGLVMTAGAVSQNLDPAQCGTKVLSIDGSAPTQIFLNDSAANKSWVLNTSTNVVYIVGYSTTSFQQKGTNATFSISLSTGSFYLPAVAANTQPIPFYLDGPNDPFTGPVWAVAAGQGGSTLLRCRTH